jgi:hypothetical protein
VPCSLLHIDAFGKPRRLGLLGAFIHKNKYMFVVDLVAHFLKLYVDYMSCEEMLRSDENRALGNWILARNFLGKIF